MIRIFSNVQSIVAFDMVIMFKIIMICVYRDGGGGGGGGGGFECHTNITL